MNVETLMYICLGEAAEDYMYDGSVKVENIDKKLAKQFELVDDNVVASGSATYIEDMRAEYIIKNVKSGGFYKISTSHDSWAEDMVGTFQGAKISRVIPEEVMTTVYNETSKLYDVEEIV